MKTCLRLAAVLALVAMCAHAQVPGITNYQGRVVANGTNVNSTGQFKFALTRRRTACGAMTARAYWVASHRVRCRWLSAKGCIPSCWARRTW